VRSLVGLFALALDIGYFKDPILVYNEIMGVIKGHEMSINTPSGYLGREDYSRLSLWSQSTFSASRDVLYDAFETYMAQKSKYYLDDAPER
jgi:hypothetical protein